MTRCDLDRHGSLPLGEIMAFAIPAERLLRERVSPVGGVSHR